jgi:carboxyl-terminal processing protease
MRKTRIVFLAVLSAVGLFFFLDRAAVHAVSAGSTMPKNLDLLERVISLIRNDYLEEKDPVPTMDGSFRGLVNSLDTGCSYLNADSTARYQGQRNQPLQQTGLILNKRYGGFPQVVGLVENSPAAGAGIEVGDSVAEINGMGAANMSLAEVDLYLDDTEAKPVDLKMLRDEKTLEFKLDRTSLFPEPFAYKAREGTGGILQVFRLTPAAALQVRAKVVPVVRKQKKALILDLRNCSGGDFTGAQQLVNLFLSSESIGYFAGRGETKETIPASAAPVLEKTPVVVWVNAATIGPAEAVAGVLKDFNRAKIVGLSTPGLAAREEYVPLDDGTSILLTNGIFCLRSGVKLWGQGVEPDAKVDAASSGPDAYLKKTQDILSTAD